MGLRRGHHQAVLAGREAVPVGPCPFSRDAAGLSSTVADRGVPSLSHVDSRNKIVRGHRPFASCWGGGISGAARLREESKRAALSVTAAELLLPYYR